MCVCVFLYEWSVSLIRQIVYYFIFAAHDRVASTEFAFLAFVIEVVFNSVKQCALNDDRRERCPSRRPTTFLNSRGIYVPVAVFICNINSIRRSVSVLRFLSFQDIWSQERRGRLRKRREWNATLTHLLFKQLRVAGSGSDSIAGTWPATVSIKGYHCATGFLGLSIISNQWLRPIPMQCDPMAVHPINSFVPILKYTKY